MFLLSYAFVISTLLTLQFNSNRKDESLFQGTSLVLSLLIKVGGFLWRHVAPMVVAIENHRTMKGYDEPRRELSHSTGC